MHGLLASEHAPAPGPSRFTLSSANLASHTSAHPARPSRTVQQYLAHPANVQGAYDLAPIDDDDLVREFDGVRTPPEVRRLLLANAEGSAAASWSGEVREGRVKDHARDEALVLHPFGNDGPLARKRSLADSAAAPRERKKPLVADALRGRNRSSAPASLVLAAQGDTVGKENAAPDSAASSVLVPRMQRLSEGCKKGKGKEKEVVRDGRKGKGGKLREEAEEQDQLDEIEERLRARRERRRAKALIRKDLTLSSTAVGTAAAAKVKVAQRARQTDNESSEEEDGQEHGRGKKRKRETKERESRKRVQELGKPKNVGPERLTLKPKPVLGIFNQGKASQRTKVGKKQHHDFAFSELAFLNPPLPPSPSTLSSSSLHADDVDDAHATNRKGRPSATAGPAPGHTGQPRTYGSKAPRRRSSAAGPTLSRNAALPAIVAAEKVATAQAQEKSEQRPRPLRFSHVEIPSSRHSAPPRAEQPAQRSGLSAGGVDGASAATGESALSAASLARRKREKEERAAATAQDAGEAVDDHFSALEGSGMDLGTYVADHGASALDMRQGQAPPPDSSALGTDSVERILTEIEDLASLSGVGAAATMRVAGHDGAEVSAEQAAPDIMHDDGLDGGLFQSFQDNYPDDPRHECPDQGAPLDTIDDDMDDRSPAFDSLEASPAMFPVQDFVGPASTFGLAGDIASPAPALVHAPPIFARSRYTMHGRAPLEQAPGFRGGSATAPLDLNDDATFREAMKRQWPRTRC
ncbi:hypothetical protein Rhopal_003590-T1 [Rhodotorula paludigena]|uniref:Proteophosphoglycan ppg4 n=1 Tax=Rhodotorula paludigena TaxID=86838 RepID=A0AAV5GPI5_9BASI|nr:hypothetical protein Rhopal_003590-T1 [Rhodotorula paludigena]